MGKAEDRVVRKLERAGGEIRVKEGSYRLPATQELFGVTNTTIRTMIEKGIVEKEGTATSTVAYKLVGYVDQGRPVTADRLQKRKAQIADTAERSLDQKRRISQAAKILFGDGFVRELPIFELMDWLELTKELMDGS